MSRASETVHGSSSQSNDDTVYVAVEKDVEKSKLTLSWALSKFRGKKFCILHVQPLAKVIALIGGDSKGSRLQYHEKRMIRTLDTKILEKIMDEYILICHQAGVYAQKLHIENGNIGEGIVDLVYRHSIKKLVIGAAADKHYSESMEYTKSKKATYVLDHVPLSCQMWFICGGHLIRSGKGGLDGAADEDRYESLQTISTFDIECSIPSRSASGSSNLRWAESESELEACDQPLYLLDSPSSCELEGSRDNQLLDQLEQVLVENENLKREAYEESIRRVKAEKNVIEATRKARALEESYNGELRRPKDIEDVFAKEKENFENMKKKWDEERLSAMDQRLLLENQISSFEYRIEELDAKIQSAVELSQAYEKERDELRVERDNALNVAEDLLTQQQAEASSSINTQQFFPEFSLSEIHEATSNFNPSLKIWEQEYGNIYKGLLRYTPVAIKVLNSDSSRDISVFQEEVDVLRKFRHPNLITLIGVCSEVCGLIYEYLPNGSLEDRLRRKDNTPPLSWQSRICIAADICSALLFLHSSSIVHGDLKAENIFLDAGFVCKLSGYGVSSVSRELSPESDIYSFGIIILQLLTGRSRSNIIDEMTEIQDMGNLQALFDTAAGNWPFVQASQLAHLALRCCDIAPRRPDLESEVWRVLEPIRASCGTPSSFRMVSVENSQPPSYFICPILQDVMQDPIVAADGYTYEAEALEGWLGSGHDTSPMTNLQLSHSNLVPNRSLRSVIQEWLQQHQ